MRTTVNIEDDILTTGQRDGQRRAGFSWEYPFPLSMGSLDTAPVRAGFEGPGRSDRTPTVSGPKQGDIQSAYQ